MKKIITIIILLFTCSACSMLDIFDDKTQDEQVSYNHFEELDKKYDYQTTASIRNYLEVEYGKLDRLDTITVISEDGRYYYFKDNNLTLGIDKRYVREKSEMLFEEFDGYTKAGALLYPNLNVNSENPIHTFSKNDLVKVVDAIGNMYYVEYENQCGFVYKTQISKNKYTTIIQPKKSTDEASSSYSSGGGGSSDSGGGGSSTPAQTTDGDDMSLVSYYSINNNNHVILLNGELNIEMQVIVDNCPTYITIFDRLDEIKYVSEDEDTIKVLINGYFGTVKKKDTKLETQDYEAWDGYTYGGTIIYSDYYLRSVITTSSKNNKIRVIDKVDDVYVIELEDGTIGYMLKQDISTKKIVTYVAPKPVEEVVSSSSSSSSGGGGGSSGSSETWTPTMK